MDSALVLQPENAAIRSLELRVWGKLEQPERLTAAARRWIAAMPGNADPYREWANALSRSGDVAAAREILEAGAAEQVIVVLPHAPDVVGHVRADLLFRLGQFLRAFRYVAENLWRHRDWREVAAGASGGLLYLSF